MTDKDALPHHPHYIKQHPARSKVITPLAFLITVLLIAVAFRIGGYRLGTGTDYIQPRVGSVSRPPSPKSAAVTTIVIQDDQFFQVTIPHGYALTNGSGDAIRYVTDEKGETIMAFYIYSGLGERSPTQGQIVIDGVPFAVNEGDIKCSADIYAENAQFKLDHLYFGIYTYCKERRSELNDVYGRVIRSLQFSDGLKEVLLGKSPPPILRH